MIVEVVEVLGFLFMFIFIYVLAELIIWWKFGWRLKVV